jgi:DNA processing protein
MSHDQLPFLMAFNSIFKLRPVDVVKIITHFGGDAITSWHNYQQWGDALQMTAAHAEEVFAQRRTIDPAQLMSEFLASGCSACAWNDDDYPAALKTIYDPPPLLFYHGRLPADGDICIAMIGSRRATPYGLQVADVFSRDLAAQGAVVVSGMARGIDSACHRGALSVQGRTIAVLGSGLDVIYPRENAGLYASICEQGAVISEFPLGTAALSINFPRRNRIISGLSQGVVVVEAGERSGTMRTVSYAAEQGRDVFAVPGNVTSASSRGVNRMIRDDGVRLALSAEDVWREYSPQPFCPAAEKRNTVKKGLSVKEQRLLHILTQPEQMDSLASRADLGISPGELGSMLILLELRGLIRKLPGNYYQTIVKRIKA